VATLAVALGALTVGCAPRSPIVRAIRARGGPLGGVVREAEARVFPEFAAGAWRWRTGFLPPDRYAWTIFTSREPNHFLYDGTVVRAFVGARQVAAGADLGAPLLVYARFTAVVNLDVLLLPGARVEALPTDALPPGVEAGLAVTLAADGAHYRLGFDRGGLLVWTAVALELWPLGHGDLVARFSDFRRTGGLLLPFRTVYSFADAPLADERTVAACANLPGILPAAFLAPDMLPECPAR